MKEEPLKSKIREDFFQNYKYTQIGNIDFVIAKHVTEKGSVSLFEEFENDDLKSLLWAEAKQGKGHDIYESFVQLILTIGKEKTFEKYLPPKFIGAFDAEKFAFINYHDIQSVFYQNDFNWNVTPSNHDTKEFRQLHSLCENLLKENSVLFRFESQSAELKEFIRLNFKAGKEASEKISVTKNNFTFVFQKWSESVKPAIKVDWERAKKAGIISADFFLADLLSQNVESLKDSLYVVLKNTRYELAKRIDELGFETSMSVGFSDRQKAHKEFWSIYARPPKEEYWDYIIARRDLLVPQDIRERKGSFFTPQIWVQKSQEYLAEVLGETWQDEYYIWDCCAGTGNLLNGLTNYDNVWASTLDKQDVDVMMDRITGGWNMPENHVFQFDFLNDSFEGQGTREEGHDERDEESGKIPAELAEILKNEEKRKRLVIYINPPYAEAGNKKAIGNEDIKNKDKVARENKVFEKYSALIGSGINELFAQFLIRIYEEIQCCKLGQFATLKALCAPNFAKFRSAFQAKLEKLFVVPGNSFDNVKGQFPIGFFVWDLNRKENFKEITAEVFDSEGKYRGKKLFFVPPEKGLWMDWLKTFHDRNSEIIGYFRTTCSDFQNQNGSFITSSPSSNDILQRRTHEISKRNFIGISVAFAVRLCIEATWLNDRDQFLYPNDGWKQDLEFQTDCLIYTLFHGQNRISAQAGSASAGSATAAATASPVPHTSSLLTNHWIPFTREQVGCKKTFRSKFMSEFLNGKRDTLGGTRDKGNGMWERTGNDLFANGGTDDDLQGFERVEKRDGLGGFGLQGDKGFSKGRDLRTCLADEKVGGVGPVEHCGGQQQENEGRVSEVSVDSARLADGAGNPGDNLAAAELHQRGDAQLDNGADRENRRAASRTDNSSSETLTATHSPCPSSHVPYPSSHIPFRPLSFLSSEARSVYDAGLELWKYYHSMPDAIADASFYDIRKHFQGTNASGKMNAASGDARYTELIGSLREKMKTLGARIAEKVYKYGFLK